jgi:hypothetical protein
MEGEITRLKVNNAKYVRFKLCLRAILAIVQSLCMRNFLLIVCAFSATIKVCRVFWHESFRFNLTLGHGVNLPWPSFCDHVKSSKWPLKPFGRRVILYVCSYNPCPVWCLSALKAVQVFSLRDVRVRGCTLNGFQKSF